VLFEDRSVSSLGKKDSEGLAGAVRTVILLKPFSQLACIGSNDVVLPRIKAFRATEDLHTDLILGDPIAGCGKGAFADVQ
jgi:hypothetical protein